MLISQIGKMPDRISGFEPKPRDFTVYRPAKRQLWKLAELNELHKDVLKAVSGRQNAFRIHIKQLFFVKSITHIRCRFLFVFVFPEALKKTRLKFRNIPFQERRR